MLRRTCAKSAPPRGVAKSRSPTHKPHPNFDCGELHEGEVVGVVLFEAGRHSAKVFDLVEEPLNEIAVAIEEAAERGDVLAVWHWLDVGPSAALGQRAPESVAVVSAIRKQDLAFSHSVQHADGASPVVSLA